MPRAITVQSAPAGEPITLAEAKCHMRVTHLDEDTLITTSIKAAREYCEDYTRRKLITQTLRMKLDYCFPCEIELPFAPAQSVTAAAFTYVDTDGTTTQVPTATYTVDTDSRPARVYLAYQKDWPTVRVQRQAISIDWIAGYGDAATDVPFQIKQAMLMMAAHFYEVRQPLTLTIGGSVAQFPKTVDDLLAPFVMHF